MKKLNNLDKIVLEIAIDDFDIGKVNLKEVNEIFNRYEHKGYDTSDYRLELNKVLEPRLFHYKPLTKADVEDWT